MNNAIRITVLVALAACAALSQVPETSSRTADLHDIERLEAEWNTINEVSDAEGKERLLTEDSYHVGPSGRLYNKAQDVEAMRSSRLQKEAANRSLKFLIHNRRIRLYEGVAVVTLTATSITTQNGQQRHGRPFRAIHVWEKRGGRWFLTVDQVTAIAN